MNVVSGFVTQIEIDNTRETHGNHGHGEVKCCRSVRSDGKRLVLMAISEVYCTYNNVICNSVHFLQSDVYCTYNRVVIVQQRRLIKSVYTM